MDVAGCDKDACGQHAVFRPKEKSIRRLALPVAEHVCRTNICCTRLQSIRPGRPWTMVLLHRGLPESQELRHACCCSAASRS